MDRISLVIDKILFLYQPTFTSGPFLLFHGDCQYWGGGKRTGIKSKGEGGHLSEREPDRKSKQVTTGWFSGLRLPAGTCNACTYKTLTSTVILLLLLFFFFSFLSFFL